MTGCTPFNEAETLMGVHLRELGLPYQQHYRYVPGRKFEADFAVWWATYEQVPTHTVDRRFALIEVQGGVYSHQAHGSITGILKDNERLFEAFKAGWPMIRFTPDQVKSGEAKAMIAAALGREP